MQTVTDSGVRRLFEDALKYLQGSLRADHLLIFYGPAVGDRLEVRAAHGVDPATVYTSAPISLSIVQQVRETGAPVYAADLQGEPGRDSSSLLLSGIRSVLCVPLRGPDLRVEGLLYADNSLAAAFSRSDLVRVSAYARGLERRVLEALEPDSAHLWPEEVEPARPEPPPPRAQAAPAVPALQLKSRRASPRPPEEGATRPASGRARAISQRG
ncbi:MAG: GAF domain-containing protein, partial [Candidatus Eremiobacterota bacterium]